MIAVKPTPEFSSDMAQIADGGMIACYTALGLMTFGSEARGPVVIDGRWFCAGNRYEFAWPPPCVVFHEDIYYFISPSRGNCYGLAPPFAVLPPRLPPGVLSRVGSPA